MKSSIYSRLLTFAACLLFVAVSGTVLAQSSANNTEEDVPVYQELPEFNRQHKLEMKAEEAENSLKIAHLSYANLPGMTVSESMKPMDLEDYTVRLNDIPLQFETGMNARTLADLQPVQFISDDDKSGSGGVSMGVGGTCGTSY